MYSTSHYSPPPTYAYQEIRPNSHLYTTNTAYTFNARPQSMYQPTTDKRRSSYTYTTTSRPATYYDPPTYTSATNTTTYKVRSSTTSKHSEQPSAAERLRSKARSFIDRDSVKLPSRSSPSTKSRRQSYAEPQYRRESVYVVDDKEDMYGYSYSPKSSPPPPYHTPAYTEGNWSARYFNNDREKENPRPMRSPRQSDFTDSKQTRQRTSSQSIPKQSTSSTKEKKSSSSSTKKAKATASDALRAGIPAGYSYKNWDPAEQPIYLLGSVFDASSLGKWIYDWTVFAHGPASPFADMAGDLWLLLIQLAGKSKRAEARVNRVRRSSDRKLISDFIEAAKRLWLRLKKILKACEDFMWQAAKSDRRSSSTGVAMGAKSGSEFVESMFGRDRRLEETVELMTSVRMWNHRFDVNCEDVLRHPSA